jgi:peptidoglycan/xylan/chitin deacetylase (PgdA/CDA1 family)
MTRNLLEKNEDFGSGPVRDYVGYGESPPKFEWPGGAGVCVQVAINYEEGSEYSIATGDGRNDEMVEISITAAPGKRDLASESMYEYGSRAGIWRILDVLKENGAESTIFAAAVALERNQQVADRIIRDQHEICSHGYRWVEHYAMTREEEKEAIRLALESFQRTCGMRPVGWYCRHGPSVHTRQLIVEEGGFLYDSDSYNDEIPYYVRVAGKSHLVIPYAPDLNDVRFVLSGGSSAEEFYQDALRAVERLLYEAGRSGVARMLSIGIHPRLFGRPARADALSRFLEYAQNRKGVITLRRDEIARFWLEHFPPDEDGVG